MHDKTGRNDACWCGSGKKYKRCHADFDDKLRSYKRKGYTVPGHHLLKTPAQIEAIKESAKVNIAVLEAVAEAIGPGMSTEELDVLVYEKTKKMGGIPAPLHYEGFPKSVCTSVNDQVCHGIPAAKDILKDGDIVNVDVSTVYNGFFSDSSRMFCIGKVSEEAAALVRVTKECIEKGLEQVQPWNFLGDVGHAVHSHALAHGYSVVRDIGGHGVGLEFHEDPWVSFVSKAKTGMLLVPGMIFTIEPMVNIGGDAVYTDRKNGWTVYTKDGSLSAQWEIMVLVTEDGHEVLAY